MLIAMRRNTLLAMVFVTYILCGCQSPNSKLVRTTHERTPASSQVDGSGDAPRSAPSMNGKKRETSTRLEDEPASIAQKKQKLTKEAIEIADLMEQGDQLRRSGKLDDARLVYQSALSISPKNPEVNHCLAIIADKQQKFALADQHYQAALKVLPNDLSLLSDLGYSYSLRGDAEEAEKTWKQALEMDPTHRGALSNLAAIYAKQDRKDEAFTLFQNSGATSKEAQLHLARLFPPQAVEGVAAADQKLANVSRQKTAPANDDVNNLSVEQLQTEIMRRQNPAKAVEDRGEAWDSHEAENGQRALLQADRPKAKIDAEIQQTAGAVHAVLTDVTPQNGTSVSASQLAMRIGMNSGPGQMFPFVAEKEDVEPVTKGMPTSGLDSKGRFGSQTSLAGSAPTTAKPAVASAALNSTRSAPPKRESLRAQPANLRDPLQGLQDSVSWDSDTQAAEENQYPLDRFLPNRFDVQTQPLQTQPSPAQPSPAQPWPAQKPAGLSRSVAGISPGKRSGNPAFQPYNGTWPNSNSLPEKPATERFEKIVLGADRIEGQANSAAANDAATRVRPATSAPGADTDWANGPNR